jgi:hypothetical protein
MGQDTWQILLQSVLNAESNEINCGECFEVLDQYAELILTGTDPVQLMPLVKRHLEQCHCCANEFELLLVMLEAAGAS